MQNQRRGGASRSGTTEMKAPARGREADPNKDRLIFVLTSLIGQRVTAKLRDNVIYEGIFHSFAADNDYAIVLKYARKLASETSKSGTVMEALVIPGKDFLQVSALDVPSAVGMEKEQNAQTGAGFRTDGEISQKANLGGERDLVAWNGGAGGGEDEALGDGPAARGNGAAWDQFERNEQMFGVSTTFNEELYTTPLDPTLIPEDKRREADRLAREIESGVQAAEQESRLDGEDDEEGRFSAVHGTGAYKKNAWGNSEAGGAAASKARGANGKGAERQSSGPPVLSQLPQIPPAPEAREDALDPRAKQRGLAANSPSMMKTSMISEMKRINALNLEPAVPKLEDKGSEWINVQNQARNANKATGGNGLKMEFQQSLELIKSRDAKAKAQQQENNMQGNSSNDNWRQGGGKGGGQLALPPEAMQQGGGNMMQRGGNMQMGSGGAGDSTRSKFSFNPNAKDFTFNPGAVSFTPTNAGGNAATGPNAMPQNQPSGMAANAQNQQQQQQQQQQNPVAKSMAPSPPFNMFAVNQQALNMSLNNILDSFFKSSNSENLGNQDPVWPEARGGSYREILGQPNPSSQLPPNLQNMGGQPMGAPWQQPPPQQQQQQPQQPMGQAPPGAPMQGGNQPPQMMPQQGFMVPAGQNPQMFQQPPMYQQGAHMQQQRPPNNQNMPPQEQQQQPMGFSQQGMMQPQPGPQQGMAMPSGMVNPQGGPNQGGFGMQPMPGGAMPKFGNQVMVMMPGQYPQQFQPQGQPGQPGPQPGGPPGGPQPGHWQQQHMMPVQMMQGGPRGPPHPMGGHEG